jgi:hypothetical protein
MRCALPQDFPADRSKTVEALEALAAKQNAPEMAKQPYVCGAHLQTSSSLKFRHPVNPLPRGTHCRLLSNSLTPSGLPIRVSPS